LVSNFNANSEFEKAISSFLNSAFLSLKIQGFEEPRLAGQENPGRGKITCTFSPNANVFPFRFCLTHLPRLLVTH
jgi:hypothetical protein